MVDPRRYVPTDQPTDLEVARRLATAPAMMNVDPRIAPTILQLIAEIERLRGDNGS